MLNALTLILPILGALGGFVLIWKLLSNSIDKFKQFQVSRHAPKDYYYDKLEIAERWSSQRKNYKSCRNAIIVSLTEGLAGMRTGVGHTEFTSYTLNIEPKIHSIIDHSTATMEEWDDHWIKFQQPLKRKEKLEYSLHMDAKGKRNKDLPGSISFITDRRLYELILRVSFEGIPPMEIWACVYDGIGNCIEKIPLHVRNLTNEAEFHFQQCRPSYTHAIEWIEAGGSLSIGQSDVRPV